MYGIYQTGSISNWKQVGGPDLPIVVVSRTTTSGTRQAFENYILGGPETLPLSPKDALNPKHIAVDTAANVASEVQMRSGAIGYVDLGTATKSLLNTTRIEGVEAFSQNVEQDHYRFWAIEHMYTKGIPDGLTAAFLLYMTKDYAQTQISALYYISYNRMSPDAKLAHQK